MLLGNCFYCGKPVDIMEGDFPKGQTTPVHTKCSEDARRPVNRRNFDCEDIPEGWSEYDIDPDIGDH